MVMSSAFGLLALVVIALPRLVGLKDVTPCSGFAAIPAGLLGNPEPI